LEREAELDPNQHRDGFAGQQAGLEPPLPDGLDCLLIETERPIERPDDANRSDAAVGPHDGVQLVNSMVAAEYLTMATARRPSARLAQCRL
jgi:hypothetical protein